MLILSEHLNSLGLVNLILEKHDFVRHMMGSLWEEQSDIKISHTEWYIMHKIYGLKTTISDVSKNVTITRQATHKNIKSLQAKGLVEISNSEFSKRDKCIALTKLGVQCCDKHTEIKYNLENKIAQMIGEDQLNVLKSILKTEWTI